MSEEITEEEIEKLQEEATENIQEAKETEKKVEKLTEAEELKQLKVKFKAMEILANQYKASIPHILHIGRPIHLNLVHKGFVYQLIIPAHALSHISQFPDAHAMLSKFGVLIAQIEEDGRKAAIETEKKAALKKEKEEQKPVEEKK